MGNRHKDSVDGLLEKCYYRDLSNWGMENGHKDSVNGLLEKCYCRDLSNWGMGNRHKVQWMVYWKSVIAETCQTATRLCKT